MVVVKFCYWGKDGVEICFLCFWGGGKGGWRVFLRVGFGCGVCSIFVGGVF